MTRQKRVAVIGAGSSGLTAIKACKEEDVDVVCFERNGDPGGLWRYHDEDLEGVASVMRTTIINTSKEMSAYSDFPPPEDFPNFMHHSKMYKYFMMYAEKFDLLQHIRYHIEVIKVVQAEDYDVTGRWSITTRDSKTGETKQEDFDGVMVCVGHHVFPKFPQFEGQENFKGQIIHTHSLKSCESFVGKNVVVVGIGNSAVDAAVDSTFVANQVYLSTRRGSWIMGRVGPTGLPYDADFSSRKRMLFNSFRSYDAICRDFEEKLNRKFDHVAYKLKPDHRFLSAHPTVNDALPNSILSGRIQVKGDISKFQEDGVIFDGDGGTATKVDVVIFATGYNIRFPFLSDDIINTKENKVQLYKYSIPPALKYKTLAVIANIQPLGAIFPIAELQSRWFMQSFKGKINLPSQKEMEKDIKRKNEANAKRYVNSTRHTIQVDFLPFLDEIAEEAGVKPNFLLMAVTDPVLFKACMMGPPYPYQYRLEGPHKWEGARSAILNSEKRVEAPLNTRPCNAEPRSKSLTVAVFSPISEIYNYFTAAALLLFRMISK